MRRRWASLSEAQRAAITAQVEATRAAVRLRKWSLTTERCYCAWVRRYSVWIALSPEARAAADSTARVTAYLAQLVAGPSPRSATTLKQALNALVWFYKDVRQQPLGRLGDIPRPKMVTRLPHVLTRDQVRDLIGAVVDSHDYPFRLICRLLYHTGMRISDVLNLRVQDIGWGQSEILLRNGKGGKDRIVPLPRALMPELRAQLARVELLHKRDQLDRIPVALPDSVYNKSARYGLAWPVVFCFCRAGPLSASEARARRALAAA